VLFVNARSGAGAAARYGVVERAAEQGIETVVLEPGQSLAALADAAAVGGADALPSGAGRSWSCQHPGLRRNHSVLGVRRLRAHHEPRTASQLRRRVIAFHGHSAPAKWRGGSCSNGHVEVADWQYTVRDETIAQHVGQVHRAGGLCVAAHPHAPYPSGVFKYPYQGFDVVEVWNGLWASDRPWNADNEAALAEWGRSLAADIPAGRWRPAMGNSDTHLEDQIGTPHTVVLAGELSTRAVLAGIRAGQSWIAGSAAIELSVTASAGHRSAGIGEQLKTRGHPAVVRADVRGVPSGAVSFHTDRGTVHRASLPGSGPGAVEWCTSVADSAFVRIEVRHPRGAHGSAQQPGHHDLRSPGNTGSPGCQHTTAQPPAVITDASPRPA
jgi:hypothetical protein